MVTNSWEQHEEVGQHMSSRVSTVNVHKVMTDNETMMTPSSHLHFCPCIPATPGRLTIPMKTMMMSQQFHNICSSSSLAPLGAFFIIHFIDTSTQAGFTLCCHCGGWNLHSHSIMSDNIHQLSHHRVSGEWIGSIQWAAPRKWRCLQMSQDWQQTNEDIKWCLTKLLWFQIKPLAFQEFENANLLCHKLTIQKHFLRWFNICPFLAMESTCVCHCR